MICFVLCISLCNPRDHCTHSLLQDCCIVKLITSNRQTYLHRGTAPWRWTVLYALVRKTMHGVIVGKRVRTRRLSDRYYTRFWMSGMFWCNQQDYATVMETRVRTKSRDYTGCVYTCWYHHLLLTFIGLPSLYYFMDIQVWDWKLTNTPTKNWKGV